MTADLDDRLTELLDRQARALDVPVWHPAEWAAGGPTVVPLPSDHRRGARGRAPLWVASAAAVALVAGGVLAFEPGPLGRADPAAGPDAPAGAGIGAQVRPIHLATPQVQLDAATITVDVAGRTFTPTGDDIQVSGDPGTAGYTTLEVTWFEDGVEMRINLYFAADANAWWVTEMRTYNGQTPGDWIGQVADGYRTPRGQVYEGEIGFGPLHMTGVRLTVSPGA